MRVPRRSTGADYLVISPDEQLHTYSPNLGKVLLIENGTKVHFFAGEDEFTVDVVNVDGISLSSIAINIPYKFWHEYTGELILNKKFKKEIEALAAEYDTVIFFCRSGGRSERIALENLIRLFLRKSTKLTQMTRMEEVVLRGVVW